MIHKKCKDNLQERFWATPHKACVQGALSDFSADCLGQYRTKIVRQMRRQIFRQMKQKAE
ncbi:hypothetical protein [Ruminococcus callidus]|uniref:hypothetical protein n=1 Tax=Ruminococcus callidus TaxID=40519 RepID=UPI00352277B9